MRSGALKRVFTEEGFRGGTDATGQSKKEQTPVSSGLSNQKVINSDTVSGDLEELKLDSSRFRDELKMKKNRSLC